MWLQVLFVVLPCFIYGSFSQKEHVTCERDYKKIGCFSTRKSEENRPDYEDMKMLINDRDPSSPYHDGYLLNWREFAESTHSLACRCAEKARKGGYTYISIRFWGECHAGKDYSVIEKYLKDGNWRSDHCSSPTFEVCEDSHKAECVGKAKADYIYQVSTSKTEKNVDGGFTSWSEWSACSATCGSNLIKERERTCTNPLPQGSGKPCEGDFTQTKACDIPLCRIDGDFSEWSDFSSCSATCGGGQMKRTRSCSNPEPANGGRLCRGSLEETKDCRSEPCPVNGRYGEWSSYSTCSSSCGLGSQERSRQCNNPTPQHNGETCDGLGDKEESKSCKLKECPINGGIGAWGSYSPCTKSCSGGTRIRIRSCDSPRPQYGGKNCAESMRQIETCNTTPCKVDGRWSEYGSYGPCTKSCGGGLQIKMRFCNSPEPKYGGKSCEGRNSMLKVCNTGKCPVDGGYSAWTSYNTCSKSCGGGVKTRSRLCNNPSPAHGGKRCERLGAASMTAHCNIQACPPTWSRQFFQRSCEHKAAMTINCGTGGRIRIDSASYGRRSLSYCGRKHWYNTACHSSRSYQQMTSRCNERQTCTVSASNAVFGDPCVYTVKYLEVKFRCRGGRHTG